MPKNPRTKSSKSSKSSKALSARAQAKKVTSGKLKVRDLTQKEVSLVAGGPDGLAAYSQ